MNKQEIFKKFVEDRYLWCKDDVVGWILRYEEWKANNCKEE